METEREGETGDMWLHFLYLAHLVLLVDSVGGEEVEGGKGSVTATE